MALGIGVCIIPPREIMPSGAPTKETMADDDLDDEFDPEVLEEELDEDALEEGELETDIDDEDDAVLVETDLVEGEEADEVAVPKARKRAAGDAEEDDEDELDPDDVEADLDTILKDRIAAVEDEDEEEEEQAPRATVESPDGVVPKRANEFVCTGCFLLVNRGQFGPSGDLQCPVGESDCPAIAELLRPPAPVKAIKATKATKATKAPAKAAKATKTKPARRK